MDPIDSIAERFAAYCLQSIRLYGYICHVLSLSDTTADALRHFASVGIAGVVDARRPEQARTDLSLFSRCVAMMDEIKRVSRRVYAANFSSCDEDGFIFNSEVSFSFACKLLACTGPVRSHFSGRPSPRRVILAEMRLATNTPLSVIDEGPELYCFEPMPGKEEIDGFV